VFCLLSSVVRETGRLIVFSRKPESHTPILSELPVSNPANGVDGFDWMHSFVSNQMEVVGSRR
jgi:hypothetical protein